MLAGPGKYRRLAVQQAAVHRGRDIARKIHGYVQPPPDLEIGG
jgi:hypothetical protein